jgi:signal transduction histidine kinase
VFAHSGVEHAQTAVTWIARHAPEARTVIVALAANGDKAEVIAADPALRSAANSRFGVRRNSIWRDALDSSQITHTMVTADLRRRLPWGEELGPERRRLACLAAPQIAPNVVVAVFHGPDLTQVLDALASLAPMLSESTLTVTPDAAILSIISNAKNEWERAVDALDELVLLVDRRGTVLRANRMVERWGLVNVSDIRGCTLHLVLHPHCSERSCRFERLLRCRWKEMHAGHPTSFELFDSQLGKALLVTLQPIAETDNLSGSTEASFAAVVVKDVTELHQAQDQLRQLNGELEIRVRDRTQQLRASNQELTEQIGARKTVEQELHASRDELARLSERLLNSQECERRRIAIELHDSLGQSLGALKYSLERYFAVNERPELADPKEVLKSTVAQLQRAINQMRSIAMSLRPSVLDDMGAVSAVRWLARWFCETYVDIDIVVDCQLTDAQIPKHLGAPVFRIVQESLNNVAMHGPARNVLVRLNRLGSRIVLEVRDDSAGFDMQSDAGRRVPHMGIIGIRERVTITGGKFSMRSGPDVGTFIQAEWELAEQRTSAMQ